MKKVMFICKRNSCRSQMAEGFAKTLGLGTIEVNFSGLEASQVDTKAIKVMSEVGIDIALRAISQNGLVAPARF